MFSGIVLLVHFVISSFYLLSLGCMEYVVPDFASHMFIYTGMCMQQECDMVYTRFVSVCNTHLENTQWCFSNLAGAQ